MKGIGQDLSSKIISVSLTRVSQRPVNDCNDPNLRLLKLQCCIVRMSRSVLTDEVIVRLAQETSVGMSFGFHANVMCLQSFVDFGYTKSRSVQVVG